VNENAPNRPTNLIGIDAGSSYGSPSYRDRDAAGGATFYLKIVDYGGTRQTARITFHDVTRSTRRRL
jgi:hypothetical protein